MGFVVPIKSIVLLVLFKSFRFPSKVDKKKITKYIWTALFEPKKSRREKKFELREIITIFDLCI